MYKYLISIFFIGVLFNGTSQDIHFSQIYNTPLLLNPALTGSHNGELRASFNYKDQWRSIDKSFQTFAFSFDHSLFKRDWENAYLAYGIYIYRDVAGSVKYGTTKALLSIAPTVKVSENSLLTAGAQLGWGNQSVDRGSFRWGNQYDGLSFDPTITSTESITFAPQNYMDLSAGISYRYQKAESEDKLNDVFEFKAGAAVHHVNNPSLSYYSDTKEQLPTRLVLHANSYFGLKNTDWGLWPQANVMFQGTHQEVMVGMLARVMFQSASKKTGFIKEVSLSAGLQARFASPFDAVIPQAFFEYKDVAIGLSYDINLSPLKAASQLRGGFEFSLRYVLPDDYYYLKPTRRVPLL